jgi:hypothetical protein
MRRDGWEMEDAPFLSHLLISSRSSVSSSHLHIFISHLLISSHHLHLASPHLASLHIFISHLLIPSLRIFIH